MSPQSTMSVPSLSLTAVPHRTVPSRSTGRVVRLFAETSSSSSLGGLCPDLGRWHNPEKGNPKFARGSTWAEACMWQSAITSRAPLLQRSHQSTVRLKGVTTYFRVNGNRVNRREQK
ncbi:hypothetical protein VNO80_01409 [Phaseolus coccineus]|uniref:Uncharacterized protein n=1 Tax=Phaseolus coccineus TaxID=3886 RepID=A0AAN9RST8_PHACN